MGKRIWTAAIGALVLGSSFAPAMEAAAQSRDRSRQNVVQIRIPRGQVCFRHVGTGTSFVGNFRRGQQLVATSTGDAENANSDVTWTTTIARNVTVRWGPRDNQGAEFNGQDPMTAPVDGRYTFTFYPNAVVGGPGVFIVCAF